MKLKDFRLATDLLPDDLQLHFLSNGGDCYLLEGLMHLPNDDVLVLGEDQEGLHAAIEEYDLLPVDLGAKDAAIAALDADDEEGTESCAVEGAGTPVCSLPEPKPLPNDVEEL